MRDNIVLPLSVPSLPFEALTSFRFVIRVAKDADVLDDLAEKKVGNFHSDVMTAP